MEEEPPSDEDGPSEHVCEACGTSFDSETELKSHVRQVGIVE